MTELKTFTLTINANGITGVVAIRWRAAEASEGLDCNNFYMLMGDLVALSKNSLHSLSDGAGGRLDRIGEHWTFIHVETPGPSGSGQLSVPYRTIKVPGKAVHDMVEIANNAGTERTTVDLMPMVPEWTRYGQGSGVVEWQVSPECADRLESLLGNDSFDRCMARIKQIALNTTNGPNDIGIARISIDGDGFTFSAAGLFGGLVNHDRDGGHNWSLHT